MKIAVTATGPTLDDAVEARFGRCAYFVIIDADSLEFEAIANPNIALGGGAGIQSAQLMANKDVSVVLTGNCGPNAFQTFGAAGIDVITGVSGEVREAVQQFKSGVLANAAAHSVQSHSGMSRAGGMGRGMGRGRGMGQGMGCGRGMGGGMSSARWASPNQSGSGSLPKDEELRSLKVEATELRKQMEVIETRIKHLEKE